MARELTSKNGRIDDKEDEDEDNEDALTAAQLARIIRNVPPANSRGRR